MILIKITRSQNCQLDLCIRNEKINFLFHKWLEALLFLCRNEHADPGP